MRPNPLLEVPRTLLSGTAAVVRVAVLVTAVAASAYAPAHAQVDFGLIASTEGVGFEVATGFSHTWRTRFSANIGTYGDDLRAGVVEYRADAKLRSLSAILDWSPGGGAFHLSIGAIVNDHKIEGTSDIETLAVNLFGQQQVDEILTLLPAGFDAGFLRAQATFAPVSPYLGFGWRSAKTAGFGFAIDLGAIYLGKADVSVTVQSDLPIDLVPNGSLLLDEFLREQELAIEEEAKDYQVYPVVRLTLFYRL